MRARAKFQMQINVKCPRALCSIGHTGGRRGALWGAGRWLVRLGLWWSVAALLLFIGVAATGALTRSLAQFNWRFALGYLAVVVPMALVCGIARRRTAAPGPDRT